MFRSKLLFKKFATYNQILPKTRTAPLAFSCLTFQKHLCNTRNDISGFKKLESVTKARTVGKGEKCFSKFVDSKCWNCEQYLEEKNFACVTCGALQPPKRRFNYFELLGFSQAFDINVEELSKKFKKLQTTFHPDKYAGKTKTEKDISETYSKLINKAYSTLKDPLQRGFYLLALLKYPDCNAPLDQEFLQKVMHRNEELECLNNENAIEKFRNSVNEQTEKYLILIKQAFKSGNLDEAKLNLSKLKYYASMNNRAKEKINELQENKSS